MESNQPPPQDPDRAFVDHGGDPHDLNLYFLRGEFPEEYAAALLQQQADLRAQQASGAPQEFVSDKAAEFLFEADRAKTRQENESQRKLENRQRIATFREEHQKQLDLNKTDAHNIISW